MLTPREVMTGVVAGGLLILLGLAPRLFQGLAEGLREGLCNFTDSLSSPFAVQPHRFEQIQTPRWWLAGLGMALIAAIAYISAKV